MNILSPGGNNTYRGDKGNPNAMIQNQLQVLRAAREKTISDIYSLEQEKRTVEQILPKIYYELLQLQAGIDEKVKETNIFNNAIEEIEQNYGNFIFSAQIFESDENWFWSSIVALFL